MGLGTREEGGNATYLVIANGAIWDKKADSTNVNYKEEEWTNTDGDKKVRKGARYNTLSGIVTNVYFKTHEQYGEALYVTLEDEGESFILNIKTNTANSQHMMKALMVADLNKELLIDPYDFEPKGQKRRRGISFKQDGEKLDLWSYQLPEEWAYDADKMASMTDKKKKRWFEDFSDFLVGEVEEKVIPNLTKGGSEDLNTTNETPNKPNEEEETNGKVVEKEAPKKITPLKMKKFLKDYIKENYDNKELPTLTKEELIVWYNLALEMEELPFPSSELEEAEVEEDDIDAQLEALAN